MIALASAAVSLLASHFGIASSRQRDVLVRRLGRRGDLGLYSLVRLVAFAGLVAAYRRAPLDVVWMARDALKLALAPIMVLAFVLAVLGLTTSNPTIVGAERLFDRPDCVRGILRVTRNPFPAGSGLWSLAHVIATGDIAGILTFGSVAVLGLAGTVVLDEKGRTYPLEWVSLREPQFQRPVRRHCRRPSALRAWRDRMVATRPCALRRRGRRAPVGLGCSPVADRGMV